ncbi:MAG TPA: phosphatase PAP2 family protein [Candidatus Saccharimonadales bacterium]|nr:phosphatase PAP2 family protein [Candidatus Saccharimonadales bacterium]
MLMVVVFGLFKFHFFWTPDILFVVLFGLFLILGQGKQFAIYFSPFLILLLSFDKLRSLAPIINHRVHYLEMPNFDKWLFGGHLPTAWLQRHLYFGHVAWYDFGFYFLYMLHFIAPIILAVVIWKFKPKYYGQFVSALLVLSYAAFITYVIFPAAPPWMSSDYGKIDHIQRISSDVWRTFGVKDFSLYYKKLAPNAVAAVPSLHAAYPFLFALTIRKIWGNKWFAISLTYPLLVGFGVVYLGEHYVFDVLLGFVYATLAFYAAPYVLQFISAQIGKLNRKYGPTLRRLERQSHGRS